jgi:hypothetical protein
MRYLTAAALSLLLPITATDVFAQSSRAVSPLHPANVIAANTRSADPGRESFQRSDSLKNGAIAGAIVGGAAMGAFMTVLIRNVGCVAEKTPCGREIAIASLMTAGAAGAGALIGAGIDAAVHDQTPGPDMRGPSGVRPMITPRRAGVGVVVRW